MKTRAIVLLFAALCMVPVAANAQIALATLVGTVQTPVTTFYNYPTIAPNATLDVTFVATNTSTTPTAITKLALSGIGFLIVNTSTLPIAIEPGKSITFFVRFTGGPVGTYQANLQVNTAIIALQGSVVQTATLTVASPCTGPDASGAISFGRVPQGQTATCTFKAANPYTQALQVSPITLTGSAFKTVQASSASIPAGQSLTFTIVFTATSATAYSGSLTIGVQTFSLSGTGFLNPLPAPTLSFGGTSLQSGKQYLLTAILPSPASTTVNGTISMSFAPASSAVKDDTAVQFFTVSSRVLPFTVDQGSTAMRFNGQTSAAFATGTTAGTITFKLDAGTVGFSGNPVTTWTIDAAPVSLTAASATRGTTSLILSMTGLDNTYSMGPMSFSFFDRSGKQLGSTISADFTADFQAFYHSQNGGVIATGSAFQLVLSFPATGDLTTVGSMNVQITNIAGVTSASSVGFP